MTTLKNPVRIAGWALPAGTRFEQRDQFALIVDHADTRATI